MMTRKEKTQQNRFDTKIEPLLKELTKLCNKFGMPMLSSVQLYENAETGARVSTQATHPTEMSLAMTLSTSLLNGTTKVRIDENNLLQLIMQKNEMPDALKVFAIKDRMNDEFYNEDDLETLQQHAEHCGDCRMMMEGAVERGEDVSNILVPNHEDLSLNTLIDELKVAKIPFILGKNNNIH